MLARPFTFVYGAQNRDFVITPIISLLTLTLPYVSIHKLKSLSHSCYFALCHGIPYNLWIAQLRNAHTPNHSAFLMKEAQAHTPAAHTHAQAEGKN